MDKTGIYFVYDGLCPLCSYTAQALHIKKQFGALHLIDVRQDINHPLIQEINRLGLNLDEGMVIFAKGHFHHGEKALQFIVRYGQVENPLMTLCKGLFWSDKVASLTYPWLRKVRNWLLKVRKIPQINNLSDSEIEQ